MKNYTQSQKIATAVALATATALPATAFAAELQQPDVSQIVTYIGYAVGAIVAIGSAKLIPSVAMWLYSNLSGMAKRG